MITILIIRGALLLGADKGIEFYVGSFDISKLADAELWKDAAVQAFFSISACCGGLVFMSSYNKFDHNILMYKTILYNRNELELIFNLFILIYF